MNQLDDRGQRGIRSKQENNDVENGANVCVVVVLKLLDVECSDYRTSLVRVADISTLPLV